MIAILERSIRLQPLPTEQFTGLENGLELWVVLRSGTFCEHYLLAAHCPENQLGQRWTYMRDFEDWLDAHD